MSVKLRIFLAIAVSMTILDQLTKFLVRRSIPLKDRVELIPGFLDLWHRSNEGAAFGIFRNFEYRIAIFTLVAMFAFGFIGYFLRGLPPKERWLPASLGFIASGALGNLIDRLVFREVTDFIDIHVGWKGGLQSWLVDHIGTYHYNTFNIADAAIVIGVAMFMIHAIFMQPKAVKKAVD
ncbi:MAG: signal peptidase II [Planctomycetes bacterium]|nr:signal peptidase II [Planctomycetota bacterium]